MTERQADHSIACGVFTNDDGLCTCKEAPSAATTEPLRAEELRDAIGDILDICEGWTGPMTPTMKIEAIKAVATKAWEGDRG